MKVAILAQRAGVSRTTLTALYYDRSKRLDLDVMDRLCRALECQPGDLFTYAPSGAPAPRGSEDDKGE